jgi:peptidoglycan/LPS O-acetylase OafA/YrhL
MAQARQLTHPKYRADIDGLRAVAVLSVVGFHAFPSLVRGGFVGVDIFFVISGFLISTIIFDNLERNSFSFVEFYSRRVRRIFPALLLVMIACLAFGWLVLFADEYKQLGNHIAAGARFVSNFMLWRESGYFDNAAATKPLLHLWSLGIEEQYYIVWPLLLWFAHRRKLNLLLITVAVAAASFALSIWETGNDAVAAFYSPQTRFWELLMGSCLAYIVRSKHSELLRFRSGNDSLQSLVGAALLLLAVLSVTTERAFPGWWALLPTAGTALIILARPQAWLNRAVLSHRVLVWFGLISFPLYLWHWPLLSFVKIINGSALPSITIRIAAVLISIQLAWLTYILVEKPIRFGGRNKLKTIALLAGMFVIGSTGYATRLNEGFRFRAVELHNPKSTFGSNPASACDYEFANGNIKNYCTSYVAENSRKTILLWGDSSTGAWLPVFLDIGKENNYTIINIMFPSCPPLIKTRKTRFDLPASKEYCSDGKTQEQVIELIRSIRPSLIVVIAAWNSYSPYTNREFITANEDGQANQESTQEAIERRVPETLRQLQSIGKLVVFKSWPFLPGNLVSNTSLLELFQRKSNPLSFSAESFYEDSRLINEVFDKTVLSNTFFYDPARNICADKCANHYRGIELYNDGYHISARGSMQFREEIAGFIGSSGVN